MLLALLLATLVRGPADVETLTRSADAVVHARVERRSATFAHGQIFTRVALRVIEAWKGDVSATMMVVTPGGVVGELDQVVQGAASFRDAEEVVLFLHRRDSGAFEVERWALGKFTVSGPSQRAIRDRAGLGCQGCAPAEQDDFSFAELRARVLGSASK